MAQVSEFKTFAEAVDALATKILEMHAATPFNNDSDFVIVAPNRMHGAIQAMSTLKLESVPGTIHFHASVAMYGPQVEGPVFLIDNKDPEFDDSMYPNMVHKFYCEEQLVPQSRKADARSMRGHTHLYVPYDGSGFTIGAHKITRPKSVSMLQWTGTNIDDMVLHTQNVFLASDEEFKKKAATEGLKIPTAAGLHMPVEVGDYVARDIENNIYVLQAYIVDAFFKDRF